MKILKRTEFGNPILRQVACKLGESEITNTKTQKLIADMKHTLIEKKLGVGLAAPQIGYNLALAVIAVRPTTHRPDVEPFDLVLINPEITEHSPRRTQMWEGCISGGPGKAGIFAKVPRYKWVNVKFYDEKSRQRVKKFKNLQAQIIQHEVDHLNGILFVDRVTDTKSYATYKEYLKQVKKERSAKKSI